MQLRKEIFFLLFIVIALHTIGQSHQYFKHFTSHEGMPSNNVYSITQDSLGFIWFGTSNGFSVFDGYSFKNKKIIKTDTSEFQIAIVRDIVESKNHRFWICTEKEGIVLYNKTNETFKQYTTSNSPLKAEKAYTICEDNNGFSFIATTEGLNVFTYDSTAHWLSDSAVFKNTEDIPKAGIRCLFLDSDELMWVGNKKNNIYAYAYRNNKYELVNSIEIPQTINQVYGITCINEQNGIIWISTWNGGVWLYSKKNKTLEQFTGFNEQNNFSALKVNSVDIYKNDIYIATWNNGLYKLDTNSKKIINWRYSSDKPYGIGNNDLRKVLIDRKENIWVGTAAEAGANMLSKLSLLFENFTLQTNTYSKVPQDIIKDKYGNMYIATKSGIFYRTNVNDVEIPIIINNKKIDINASSLEYDSINNNLWIGTEGQGLIKYNIRTKWAKQFVRNENDPNSLSGNTVLCMYYDYAGKLWIGTWSGGMSVYHTEFNIFETFPLKKHEHNYGIVMDIEPQGDSILWLASFDSGILKYSIKNNTAQSFFTEAIGEYKGDGTFLTIKVAQNGNIWAGSLSNGIIEFSPYTNDFTCYRCETLISTSLIEEDDDGIIWVASNNQILSFKDTVIRSYGIAHGLINNSYPIGSSCILNNGSIVFGGNKNIVVFNPKNLINNDYVFTPVFTSITVHSADSIKAIAYTSPGTTHKIEVDYGKSLSFEFSALNYVNPHNIKYQYKLEGLDNKWHTTNADQRKVFFSNLKSGTYTLKVKCSNGNSIWSNRIAACDIIIKKPFWQQIWFILFSLTTVVFTLWLIIKIRTHSLIRANETLENAVKLRTEKISQQNEEIRLQRDNILEQKLQIERAHKDTTDSIIYAKQIQEAILPSEQVLKHYFPNSFVYYKPRNIVSGDFFWIHSSENKQIIAAADCTGHGVPGAFLSILGVSTLNELATKGIINSSAEILNKLRLKFKESLTKEDANKTSKDGIDMSLCIIEQEKNRICFPGAYNPVYIINKSGELTEYKADKMPIGSHIKDQNPFSEIYFNYEPGSMLYMFSDGYFDQFGGKDGKKLKTTGFKNLLISIHDLPENEQYKFLSEFQESRMDIQNTEQVDDILVIGIRL